ncbi:MAG: hypothetical protein L0387_24570 [Acidobacteria bacterium]|nr:hypothetical protein [Acidobacteriota bacterium]
MKCLLQLVDRLRQPVGSDWRRPSRHEHREKGVRIVKSEQLEKREHPLTSPKRISPFAGFLDLHFYQLAKFRWVIGEEFVLLDFGYCRQFLHRWVAD